MSRQQKHVKMENIIKQLGLERCVLHQVFCVHMKINQNFLQKKEKTVFYLDMEFCSLDGLSHLAEDPFEVVISGTAKNLSRF